MNSAPLAELTERELEILPFMVQDRRPEEIAGELFISVATVRTHEQHIREKLGARSRLEAVVAALRLRLVSLHDVQASGRNVGADEASDGALRGDVPCDDCGTGENLIWFTDNVLWNEICPNDGVLCILCFARRVEAAGYRPLAWRLLPHWEPTRAVATADEGPSK